MTPLPKTLRKVAKDLGRMHGHQQWSLDQRQAINAAADLIEQQAAEIERLATELAAANEMKNAAHAKVDDFAARYVREAKECNALRVRLADAVEAMRGIRILVQDCIENSHDRGALGNLYAARDSIDAFSKARW